MNCPICDIPMIVVERGAVEVDFCISCRGIWFDEGEIAVLAERLGTELDLARIGRPAAVPSREAKRKCPRCDREMEKLEITGARRVVIDQCVKEHGIWLDRGELGSILEAPPAESDESPILTFLGEVISRRSG